MKRFSEILYLILCVFLAVFLLIFPDIGKKEAYGALILCAKSVIPVLFPFSVIASCLTDSRIFTGILSKTKISGIFGLPDVCSSAIIFGWIFGFPIGAKTAVELFSKGYIEKNDAERLIAVSNNSGPAFIVSVIGKGFFNNRKFGIYLYFLQVISGIIAGFIIIRCIFRRKKHKTGTVLRFEEKPLSMSITDAVKNSAIASINICGYILIFSVLTSVIKTVSGTGALYVVISSFLELTCGTRACAEFGNAPLCAFAVGFSGFSVLCQVMSFAREEKLSLKLLFISKLLQGVLCFVITYFVFKEIPVNVNILNYNVSSLYSYISVIILTVFSIKFAISRKNS